MSYTHGILLRILELNGDANKNHSSWSAASSSSSRQTSSGENDVMSIEELLATYQLDRDRSKVMGIGRGAAGIASLISSSILIWMIIRSRRGLSTTQHRLLLGLCVFDLLSSLSYSTFNATAPSDDNYFVWNARGDEVTCTIQGFALILGIIGGLFYNSALNLYYLAVIKYEKNDNYIRSKLEPFMHAVPFIATLTFSIAALAKQHYNDNKSGVCIWPSYNPPHCVGYDVGDVRDDDYFDIPCGRGLEGSKILNLATVALILLPVMIMIVSLTMIYKKVRRNENILEGYGATVLRKNIRRNASNVVSGNDDGDDIGTGASTVQSSNPSSMWSRIGFSFRTMKTWSWRIASHSRTSHARAHAYASKRSSSKKQTRCHSRAVMHKAIAYSSAWFISFGFYIIGYVFIFAGKPWPIAMAYLNSIFLPLQGMFNLIIFMHPKVVLAKKDKNLTWCGAFKKAFWSRGAKASNRSVVLNGGNGGGRCYYNRACCSCNCRRQDRRSSIPKKAQTGTDAKVPTLSSLRAARSLRQSQPHSHSHKRREHRKNEMEEEKTEIQATDNFVMLRHEKGGSRGTSSNMYASNVCEDELELELELKIARAQLKISHENMACLILDEEVSSIESDDWIEESNITGAYDAIAEDAGADAEDDDADGHESSTIKYSFRSDGSDPMLVRTMSIIGEDNVRVHVPFYWNNENEKNHNSDGDDIEGGASVSTGTRSSPKMLCLDSEKERKKKVRISVETDR